MRHLLGMEDITRDEIDRKILTMRLEGHTLEDIGRSVGMYKTSVFKRLRKIGDRYREYHSEA